MEHLFLLVILPLLALAMASMIPCNAAPEEPIYDTDGHEVTSEDLYYILPANRSLGGQGLYTSSLGQYECPLRVVLARYLDAGDLGMPVSIKPATNDSDGLPPRLSSDVVIAFNHTLSMCMMRLQWHIDVEITGQKHVTVGHQLAAPERQSTWDDTFLFRVQRHIGAGAGAGAGTPEGYNLASCYRAGRDKAPCLDLGLYEYSKRTWLTVLAKDVRHEPLLVVFKKCPPPCWPHA